jgi:hypothetical protein
LRYITKIIHFKTKFNQWAISLENTEIQGKIEKFPVFSFFGTGLALIIYIKLFRGVGYE